MEKDKKHTLNYNPDNTEIGHGLNELLENEQFRNRYRIIEIIGQGGFACVFKAEDKKLNEEVAIKIYRPGIFTDENFQLLQNEIKLSRRIRHPGILPVHEFGQYDQIYYLVTPYLKGKTLRQFLKQDKRLSYE